MTFKKGREYGGALTVWLIRPLYRLAMPWIFAQGFENTRIL
jgi:hypothetical protein